MKKLLLSLLALATISTVSAADFTSYQLASSTLTNGYVLQTNGRNNRWVATSSLGFSGSGITNAYASSTFAKLYESNLFTGLNYFNATSTLFSLITSLIQASSSAGIIFNSNNGTQVANFGAGGGSNATFSGGVSVAGTLGVTSTSTLATTTATVLGVGTTTPSAAISVNGDSYFGGNVYATGTLTGGLGGFVADTTGISQLNGVAVTLNNTGFSTSRNNPFSFTNTNTGSGGTACVTSAGQFPCIIITGGGNGSSYLALRGSNNASPTATSGVVFFGGSSGTSELGRFVGSNGFFSVGSTSPSSLLSVGSTTMSLNSQSLFSLATSSTIFSVNADGTVFINGTTSGSTLTINAPATAGTGIGINLNSISGNGVGISMTGLTSNSVVGIDTTLGGSNTQALRVNTTGAGNTTARALGITGTANITADYSGAYIYMDSVRNVAAAATRVFSGNAMNISPSFTISGANASILNVTGTTTNFVRTLSNAGTNASAAITVTAPVVSIANVKGAGTGTTTDSSAVLEINQAYATSTGTVLKLFNIGVGHLASFLGNGNLGIGTSTFNSDITNGKLKVDVGTNISSSSNSVISAVGSINDYLSVTVTNASSSGNSVEAGFTAQNASSTATSTFGWFGINGPMFGTSTTYSVGYRNDVTLLSKAADMYIGNISSGQKLSFLNGGTSTSTNAVMTFISGLIGIGTTSPQFALTVASGTIVSLEKQQASSTSITVDWKNGNQQYIRHGTSATTIIFANGTTTPGATLRLIVCNAPSGTAGALTFTHVYWPSATMPTQTTTANKCDVWSFLSTMSTSSNAVIFGNQSAGF